MGDSAAMRSPFPGMDPFLEAHWLDVHTAVVAACRASLNERLPDDLIARAEEREVIERNESGLPRHRSRDTRPVALAEPITERFIEILDASGERLVSVIEFVSPTNKRGKGLDAFVAKREELLSGGVNLIEIDLTRSAGWEALLRPHCCPREALASYRATIHLPNDRMAVYLHPLPLRLPLPGLKIPLRAGEPPVELPLQPLIEQVYREGRYGRTIDYWADPDPPLDGDDARWADQLLRAAGRRS